MMSKLTFAGVTLASEMRRTAFNRNSAINGARQIGQLFA